MATAKCPACGLNLQGVPDTRRVLVTCPLPKGGCGSKFYFPPTEYSTLNMRCAQDGRWFTASFKRDVGQPYFTIYQLAPVPQNQSTQGFPEKHETAAYNTSIYDFTGFYCPCCGYIAAERHETTVQCSECKQLVCQSLTYEKLDGAGNTVRWFVCYPACGNQGAIGGFIPKFEAKQKSITERAPTGYLQSGTPPLKLRKD